MIRLYESLVKLDKIDEESTVFDVLEFLKLKFSLTQEELDSISLWY